MYKLIFIVLVAIWTQNVLAETSNSYSAARATAQAKSETSNSHSAARSTAQAESETSNSHSAARSTAQAESGATSTSTVQHNSNNNNSNNNNKGNNNNNKGNNKPICCPGKVQCGLNEIYVPCPKPTCANQTCENIGKQFECPEIPADYKCKGECRCKDGYYRSKIGQCITEEQCKRCPGKFEYFACDNPCDNECDKLSKQSHKNCPIVNVVCNEKCYCLEGYARDAKGVCIPIAQCPPECPQENEEYSYCPLQECRPKTCDELGYPLKCLQPSYNATKCGKPGCICKQNYVRDSNGICIENRKCPSCGGDPNAWSGSGTFCTTCDNYKSGNVPCPRIYKFNGCDCRPGYVYNRKSKKCVLPKNCPNTTTCGVNEVFDECPTSCPPRTCETKDREYKCLAPLLPGDPNCKPPACRCADNYYRNSQGKCVKKDECPNTTTCGVNEVFDECPTSCPPRTCETKDREYKCLAPLLPGDPNCNPPACRCADNYYRNSQGKCVKKEECPPTCGVNEVPSDCANSPCIKNCATKDQNYQCRPDPSSCKPGCVCADGYYRNDNGTCVPENQCPQVQCGLNEIYIPCPKPTCANQTCENIGKQLNCPNIPADYKCKGECRCKDGYYRSKIGQCITEEQCKRCPGKFEYYACDNACDNECDKLSKQSHKNCPILNVKCNEMCYCLEGYARDAKGDCIPIDQCPRSEICPKKNEYYDLCPASCPARTCGIDDRVVRCKDPPKPGDPDCNPPACRCDSGFYRSPNGECVTFEECPPVCGLNEVPFDCVNSPCLRNKCSQRNRKDICRRKPANCTPGCICADGYLRADNGTCVRKEQCPPICPEFEVPSDCINGGCDKRNCSQLAQPALCIDLIEGACIQGCVCQKGYLRTAAGVCVPSNQCPKNEVCPKKNEYYDACPPSCPARKCGIDDRLIRCKEQPQPGDPDCNPPACFCESGFYRNEEGECVTFEECEGENEELSDCPNKVCRPQTCDQLGFPLSCNSTAECEKPAYICKSGFVRNKNGVCKPAKECPCCGGDPNATTGCGTFCKRCSNYKDKNRVCNKACINNGCECRPKYVYDANKKRCVLPKDCKTTTPTPSTPISSNPLEDFNKGNAQFTAEFFNAVVKNNPGKSVILSPYTVLILLTQPGLYATGELKKQLYSAFNLNNPEEIRVAIPAILDSILEQRNVTFSLAERVYGNIRSTFSEQFLKDTKVIYEAEAENIDMDNGKAAADYINEWVASQTNNKITDLIPPTLITPDTELVLVNAIYCLAEWRNKFNVQNTRPDDFFLSENNKITVDMMNQVLYVNYTESAQYDAKAIELPYVNNNLTCLIILPNKIDGAASLVEKLVEPNALQSIRNTFKSQKTSVSIPKFNTTTTIDLKEILKQIGQTELFNENSGGLDGILADPSIKIQITSGIQKATIILNESGSEAAAATAIIGVGITSVQEPPIEFRVNYPFIYYIMYRGTPIFCAMFAGNT